ncbi:GIY-YIG nuclease family protein [Shewanella donghaensis]|uniref:GIY-YIG nuclease family protein n=1 Tax=Shewanella donghaensis TaxID=238836 RepID=UPI0011837A4E|nr:GIY-YIG nuclease family protein [Shewanella donghaensis]
MSTNIQENISETKSRSLSTDTKSDIPAAPWYLYMIKCRNSHLYTGVTTDIKRRFAEHQAGGAKAAKYLKGKGPLTLVYQETLTDRSHALKREIAVKKLSRSHKLALIAGSVEQKSI